MSWTDTLINILLVVYVLDCIFMGLVIMMQRSKQEGLGAAFGGGFTESIWGAQTSNVLVKGTVWAAALFFILSIALARLYTYREATTLQHNNQPSTILQQLTTPVPSTPTNAAGLPVMPTGSPMSNTAPMATSATSVAPGSTNPAPVSVATPPMTAPVPPANATNAAKPTNNK